MKIIKKTLAWLLAALLLIAGVSLGVGIYISAPKHHGEPSSNFNGKEFVNIGGIKSKGTLEVLKWALNRQKDPWPTTGQHKLGHAPTVDITDSTTRITFVNHSSFLIQWPGYNLLTDPVWSERASPFQWVGPKRKRPAGIAMDSLPEINGIVISHNHYDHLDLPTLKKLFARYKPHIYVPLGVKAYLANNGIDNVTEMDWWDDATLSQGIQLTAVPAQHFSGRGILDKDATLWCGYTMHAPNANIYFAGDTGYGGFVKTIAEKSGPIDIALLPIGAYKPNWFMSPVHTSPSEAVKMHIDLQAQTSIPIHFGTFQLADDGLSEPLEDLSTALDVHNLPSESFLILKEGEGKTFGRMNDERH